LFCSFKLKPFSWDSLQDKEIQEKEIIFKQILFFLFLFLQREIEREKSV